MLEAVGIIVLLLLLLLLLSEKAKCRRRHFVDAAVISARYTADNGAVGQLGHGS